MMCVAGSMSSWLWIWPPLEGTENSRKQPNRKRLINKKPETTPLQQEIIATYTYILVVYSEDEQKYKFLCQLTEREKNT